MTLWYADVPAGDANICAAAGGRLHAGQLRIGSEYRPVALCWPPECAAAAEGDRRWLYEEVFGEAFIWQWAKLQGATPELHVSLLPTSAMMVTGLAQEASPALVIVFVLLVATALEAALARSPSLVRACSL